MDQFSKWAMEVQMVCPEQSLADIRRDLQHTRSVDLTINRIFDGEFLVGLKPSTAASSFSKKRIFSLDDDEDGDDFEYCKSKLDDDSNMNVVSLLSSDEDNHHHKPPSGNNGKKSTSFIDLYDDDDEEDLAFPSSAAGRGANGYTAGKSKAVAATTTKNNITGGFVNTHGSESEDSDAVLRKKKPKKKESAPPRPKQIAAANKVQLDHAASDNNNDDSEDSNQKVSSGQATKQKTSVKEFYSSNDASAAEKQEAKRLKLEEKERAKELKRIHAARKKNEKQQQVQEKKRLKTANKIRTKLQCMEEMIVSFDNEFIQKNSGSVSLAEVQEIGGVVAVKNHNIASSVIWQRRSTRRRDEEADCWVPCAETITEEPFILVKHSGQDFAAMIGNGRLVALVNDIRRLHPEKKFIFMIEGIEKVYRTNLQKTNQQFQAAVRGEQDPSSRSNSFPQLPDKDVIDSKLLWLQFHVRCQVQHAKTPSETAEWIAAISKEIAVIPENKYRSLEANDVHFAGSFKSGKDSADTWKRMLIHFRDVSEDKAKAIVCTFPTFQSLWQTYKRCRTDEDGRKVLIGVEVRKPGRNDVRRLGVSLSTRIYDGLTGSDPNEIFIK